MANLNTISTPRDYFKLRLFELGGNVNHAPTDFKVGRYLLASELKKFWNRMQKCGYEHSQFGICESIVVDQVTTFVD